MAVHQKQLNFLKDDASFPSTRFQGSKLKLVDWIWGHIKDLQFKTALDAFGGTGCVSHKLKCHNKEVTYNDILKFNWYIGKALIENDNVALEQRDIDFLLTRHSDIKYPSFVSDNFKDIYFTENENKWIDTTVTNIEHLDNQYKKALAYYCLFQSCIIKRPFNLFHRKNLYIRFSKVERNFGNKTTWDTPFDQHFAKFASEANEAVFSNYRNNKAINSDIFDIEGYFDLIYIDTPYISKKGSGVDYLGFYHFLEGLANYKNWSGLIDYKSKHKRLKKKPCVWTNTKQIHEGFERLFEKFRKSILVVSYRSDGIPTINELIGLMRKYKSTVIDIKKRNYKYVLSNNNSQEILLIGS